MMCNCPKCHAKIELDLTDVTEAGTSAACPACSARFSVHRESFGARALRNSSEISCAPCGSELGSQIHCPTCGAQFPDYLVASLGRKRTRATSKKVKLHTSPLPHAGTATSHLPTLEMAMKPEAAPKGAVATGMSKPVAVAVSLLVALALIAAGSVYYFKSKAEKTYVQNFVLATYCIQTGVDKSLKASARMASEWKAKTDAAQPYKPHLGADEEKSLATISNKLETVKQDLTKTPEKFRQGNEKLAKLEAVYTKLRSLALSPGNSLQNFTETTGKLDGEYKQAVKEFRSGLPEELMKGLVSASQKFNGLRPLLKE